MLRDAEEDFREELNHSRRAWQASQERRSVEPCHIREVLSQWTGVPVTDLDDGDRRALLSWRTICAGSCWAKMPQWNRWPEPSDGDGWD